MNREDIVEEAYRRFPLYSTDFEMMQRSDVMWDGFVEGAEWMQEQCHKDLLDASAEIERPHVQDVRDLQEQMKLLIDKMIEYNVDDCEEIWYDIARYDENWCANNCQKFCKKCVDKWLEAKQAMKGDIQ